MLISWTHKGLIETFLWLQIRDFIRTRPKEKKLELLLDPEDMAVLKAIITQTRTFDSPFEVTVGKRKRRVFVYVPSQDRLRIDFQRVK